MIPHILPEMRMSPLFPGTQSTDLPPKHWRLECSQLWHRRQPIRITRHIVIQFGPFNEFNHYTPRVSHSTRPEHDVIRKVTQRVDSEMQMERDCPRASRLVESTYQNQLFNRPSHDKRSCHVCRGCEPSFSPWQNVCNGSTCHMSTNVSLPKAILHCSLTSYTVVPPTHSKPTLTSPLLNHRHSSV